MPKLIVQAKTADRLQSIVSAAVACTYVQSIAPYNGLKRFAVVEYSGGEIGKNACLDFFEGLDEVAIAFDGDQQMELQTQDSNSITLPRDAASTWPAGLTQYFHMWSPTGRRPNMIPWTQRPYATSFTTESDRQGGTGAGIIASIHDSGIDDSHTDEFGVTSRVTNVFDAHSDGPGDHGTAVASIFAGATMGFLPDATILNCKCFNSANVGTVSDALDSFDELITWLTANRSGEHVIANASFGVYATFDNGYGTAIDDLEAEGICVFAASGNFDNDNDNGTRFFPAGNMRWSSVGAVDLRGDRTHFSGYGYGTAFHGLGIKVPSAYTGNGNYSFKNGTSFACPAAAGAFGTWVADKDVPASQSDVWELYEQYYAFSKAAKVRQKPHETRAISPNACIARADNSPV